MCTTCGCSDTARVSLSPPPPRSGVDVGGLRDLRPDSAPARPSVRAEPTHVALEAAILGENDRLAAGLRADFAARGILALNLVSSPGAGKTTLLERTVRALHGEWPTAVIEGDQATEFDAARIRAAGCDAVQVNTGTGCHLDASMIGRALAALQPPDGTLLLIENVGNLVCPALFDLGEQAKVVVLSVTEGDDKPLKYPHMFRAARLMLVNKIDLAPHVDFDLKRCLAFAREVNPTIEHLSVSARTGEGIPAWYDWLRARRPAAGRVGSAADVARALA